MRILDVGCGGRCRGTTGISLDFTEGPNSRALDRWLGFPKDDPELIKHDLNEHPWPGGDESFDLIIASHILEHLQSPYQALEECHRLLKGGGGIRIAVPNAGIRPVDDAIDDGHICSFTRWSLENLVSHFFTIEKLDLILREGNILIEARKR